MLAAIKTLPAYFPALDPALAPACATSSEAYSPAFPLEQCHQLVALYLFPPTSFALAFDGAAAADNLFSMLMEIPKVVDTIL